MNDSTMMVQAIAQMRLKSQNCGPSPLSSDTIRSTVLEAVGFLDATSVDIERIVANLETSFQTLIGAERKLSTDEGGWKPWLPKKRASIEWKFWERYKRHLLEHKGWPSATIDRLDQATDSILGQLVDPDNKEAWDRRGMVVGHVQSGKTSNYVGLICKAADAGYKIIIVLAGFHKSLRSQTQIRLEEGFLGYSRSGKTSDPRERVGVGLIDPTLLPNSITTRADNGDFKRSIAKNFSIRPGGSPLLFVVKKNGSVLKNLLNWVKFSAGSTDEKGRGYIKDVPLLVIDDEADQGSIDTKKIRTDKDGKLDQNHDPTIINKRIRNLLRAFDQSAYIGYTATPFANILIHNEAKTDSLREDLFPRSFIFSLPTPSNYIGPAKVFGLAASEDEENEEDEGLPIIREVDDFADSPSLEEREGWVPPKHRKDWVPQYEGKRQVPPSLREAIRAFILVCAARRARGDVHAHNSMLVHVTRFTDVQKLVAEQVQRELRDFQLKLKHESASATTLEPFEELWVDDFVSTLQKLHERNMATDCRALTWDELLPHLKQAALSIEVREINGTAKEVLDYEANRDEGLNVIAIGGDKLSRGLTLEGLSVSYFLRASRMYDTLMQMGRWFGYRPRYLDLCRLYTTPELIEWFGHITVASEELRADFNRMASSGGTPQDFGHRVQDHPSMLVTSAVKMRNGQKIDLTFEGAISETINFLRKRDEVHGNLTAVQNLFKEINAAGIKPLAGTVRNQRKKKAKHGGWTWVHVPSEAIVNFLSSYQEHKASKRVKSKLLSEYIQAEVAERRLTDWTVYLASGQTKSTVSFGPIFVKMVERAFHGSAKQRQLLRKENHYRIRRLVSPTDEAADLNDEEWKSAFQKTLADWNNDPQTKKPKRPSGPHIRSIRPPDRGLLMIYPLAPGPENKKKVESMDFPVIAFGISFPFVRQGRASRTSWIINSVYAQELLDGES